MASAVAVMLGPVRKLWRRQKPIGKSRGEILNQIEPISRVFGLDRGKAIDRHYSELFLSSCREDIRGRVLEIENNTYTKAFGANRVQVSDVLHVVPGNPAATVIDDLTDANTIASNAYDC